MKIVRWRITPMFAWYDFWVGLFWDDNKRRLYVFPVPMFGFMIERTPREALPQKLGETKIDE